MPETENDVDRVAQLIAWHSTGRSVVDVPDADPQLVGTADSTHGSPAPADLRSA